jgi:hypothetical protein
MAFLENEHFVSPSINERISTSVSQRTPDNFLPRPSNLDLSLTVLGVTLKRFETCFSENRLGNNGTCNEEFANGHGSRSFMKDQSILAMTSTELAMTSTGLGNSNESNSSSVMLLRFPMK